ncbi:MAG: hypothetical protein ACK5II_11855 [Paracoccus sp. (in: a-proteobacteria)]
MHRLRVTQQGTEFNKARGEAIRILKGELDTAGYSAPKPVHHILVDDDEDSQPDTSDNPAGPAGHPATDITPDAAFDRMVEAGKDDGEPNLLSKDAPQE